MAEIPNLGRLSDSPDTPKSWRGKADWENPATKSASNLFTLW